MDLCGVCTEERGFGSSREATPAGSIMSGRGTSGGPSKWADVCSFIFFKATAGKPNTELTWAVGMAAGSSEFEKWHKGGGLFHKSACVDPTAVIETGAVVQKKSVLGANVHLGSGAVIGPSVNIRQSTKIGYNVILSNCLAGDSCVIHNGVCIGQDVHDAMLEDVVYPVEIVGKRIRY